MRGRNPRSHPEGGPTVVPGRTGAAWGRCRRQVIADSGDMCAVCGEYVDPHAPKFSDGQGEVDHVIPLRRLKQMYPDLVEYAAQANDPSNCRYVHRSPCHEATPCSVGNRSGHVRASGMTTSQASTPEWRTLTISTKLSHAYRPSETSHDPCIGSQSDNRDSLQSTPERPRRWNGPRHRRRLLYE
jgi:hypothetical protein